MTYSASNPIQALDYNTFATAAGGMNEVFADSFSGATTLPDAGYGYGQTPALTSVTADSPITVTEWNALYQTIRNCGTHQGTTVVPPLPASNPSAGDPITAYNTPTLLSTVINSLHTNRFSLAVGQTSFTSAAYVQPGATPWTNSLTFNFSTDFGSWNNARYFFNSGGFITLSGNYASPVTPEEIEWATMLTNMSPLVFNYNSTTPNTGSGGTALGFYNLTTTYQTIYLKNYGSGPYSASYIQVQARLAAAAGTNGLVQFTIALVNLDATPPLTSKTGTTTFTVSEFHSSGAIVYPGTVTKTNLGFIST